MESDQSNDQNVNVHGEPLLSLRQKNSSFWNFAKEDITEWMKANEQQEIADNIISDMVENCEQMNNDGENDVHQKELTHPKGLSSFEKTTEFIEQQEKALIEILMTFEKWHTIAKPTKKKELSFNKQKSNKTSSKEI